ncbi:hypothetical protein R3P38DRAFT_2796511 [Favolaschia claudopus]|uniref:Uncharacterized protein n=1 Tax=Favolaschia claudopus TaxID=2862362 RepID=A0AAW0A5A0_9AGAR
MPPNNTLSSTSTFTAYLSSPTSSDEEDPIHLTGDQAEDPVLQAFWQRISELTARTRTDEGVWVGSREIREWNEGHTGPCRDGKMACDRKTQFLFDYTRHQFFDDMDQFLRVYGRKDKSKCKPYRKQAVKKLRDNMPYTKAPKKRVILGDSPAILTYSSPGIKGRLTWTPAQCLGLLQDVQHLGSSAPQEVKLACLDLAIHILQSYVAAERESVQAA